MQSEKITRTKLLKENQHYFFTLNQATNLPSEVKDLIDSYLYIILLLQPIQLLKQIKGVIKAKEIVELFKDSDLHIARFRNILVQPTSDYFLSYYNKPPPPREYHLQLSNQYIDLKEFFHLKSKININSQDIFLDHAIITKGKGSWRFDFNITIPESELRFILSTEDWDLPAPDHFNFLPDHIYFDPEQAWIKVQFCHNKQESLRRLIFLKSLTSQRIKFISKNH